MRYEVKVIIAVIAVIAILIVSGLSLLYYNGYKGDKECASECKARFNVTFHDFMICAPSYLYRNECCICCVKQNSCNYAIMEITRSVLNI